MHLCYNKQLVTKILCPSIILNTRPILIQTELWLILKTILHERSLVNQTPLEERVTNNICGMFWLATKLWSISKTIPKGRTTLGGGEVNPHLWLAVARGEIRTPLPAEIMAGGWRGICGTWDEVPREGAWLSDPRGSRPKLVSVASQRLHLLGSGCRPRALSFPSTAPSGSLRPSLPVTMPMPLPLSVVGELPNS